MNCVILAWQGKDFWRKKWEDHWASRLAHMYKHKEELDSLEDNFKVREAQYNQVRDWYTMSKGIMNEEVRAEWYFSEICTSIFHV